MPVTNPAERAQLKALGFDPDVYNDPVVPAQTEQQNPVVKSSPLGAGVRSVLRNTLPSLGAIAGAGAAIETGPLAIGSGLVGGALADKLQREAIQNLLPESWSKAYFDSEAQDKAEHPYISALAGTLNPAMRLGSGTVTAASGVIKGLRGLNINPNELNALKNLGVNAAVQGGIDIGSQMSEQGTLTPKLGIPDALSVLGGALQSTPTRLGIKMGLHADVPVQTEQQNPAKTAEVVAPKVEEPVVQPKIIAPTESVDNAQQGIQANQISQVFQNIGQSVTGNLYQGLFDAFNGADNVFKKMNDPILTKYKKEWDAGLIKTPQDIQDLVNGKTIQPVIEQTKVEPAAEVKPVESSQDTLSKLIDIRSQLEPGTPEFVEAHKNVMSELAKEDPKALNVAEEKPIIGEEIKKAKVAKAQEAGIDTNDPEQLKLIQESEHNPVTIPVDYQREAHLGFARPEIDKLKAIGTPDAQLAAKGLADLIEKHTEYQGKLVNPLVHELGNITGLHNPLTALVTQPLNYLKQSTPEMAEVQHYIDTQKRGETPKPLSPKGQQIKDAFETSFDRVRALAIEKGKTLGHEAEGFTKGYHPEMIDSNVRDILVNKPESSQALQLADDFIKDRTKRYLDKNTELDVAQTKATTDLRDFLKGMREGNNQATIGKFFGPLDKAAGLGLPESWRPSNIVDTANRYLESSARRLAFHDAIETKPEIVKALAKYAGHDSVKAIVHGMTGIKNVDERLFKAATGLVSRAVIGPISGVRDVFTSPFIDWQHLSSPPKAVKFTAQAIAEIPKSIEQLRASGRIQKHMNVLELDQYTDSFVSGLRQLGTRTGAINAIRRATNIVSDFNGKNLGDKIGRAINYGQGKFAALQAFKEYNEGKLSSGGRRFLQNFAADIDLSKPLDEESLRKIASRYVDSAQGTYGAKGLPRQVTEEGYVGAVLQLAKWSIEKSNNYMKYAVTPLINGDPKPFLMSALGTAMGGALSLGIVEALTKRKQHVASIDELKEAKKEGQNILPDIFYKMSALVSAGGQTGIMGDVLKSGLDAAYGKNRPQVFDSILAQSIGNTYAISKSFIQQVEEDGFSPELTVQVVSKMIENNFQAYRLMQAYLSSSKQADIDKANKLRDLRVFNTLSGNKITDLSSPFQTRLEDLKTKQYKDETNLDKIPDEAIALLERADRRSGGDPTKLQQEFKSLKGNSYQTMPNPKDKTQSQAFDDYYNFLVKTQGKEEADKRVDDFIERNALNKIKSKLIP